MNSGKDTIKRIRQGDIQAYEALFRSLYPNLCKYANSLVHDTDQAEEIVQEIFYRLWRDRKKTEITSSLKSYLYRAVYNNALQHLKHQQVRERYSRHRKTRETEYAPDPYQELRATQLQQVLMQTLEDLPERCREIFYMNRYEGLKYKEIAESLSISVKTVEANMTRALKEFRRVVAQLEIEQ